MKGTRIGIGTAVATLTLAGGVGTAHADKFEVTSKAVDGKGSLAAAIKKANKQQGGDEISFAKSLRGSIDLPEEVVTLQGKLVIEGNGYGAADGKNFGKLVLSGHRGGSQLTADRDANVSLRDLYLDGVALDGNRAKLTVKDSFLDGERTVDETGITIEVGGPPGARLDRPGVRSRHHRERRRADRRVDDRRKRGRWRHFRQRHSRHQQLDDLGQRGLG